ncbi:uncharacterized protein LOC124663060 [Lolium rigidum]|uniref:uncharacterized protein LOC124663060 n=1 Tax=Lolium rigidum TaxID=89674 RepID=UPI001F5E18FA|nr:uncharacterized protein LOC124663060 [Lolium rigidum]
MGRDATVAPQPVAAGAPELGKAESMVIDVDAVAAVHGVACRICHLSPEGGDGPATLPGAEVIRLGCGCKEELGDAHRQCAEAWFRIKGDRRCEICGSVAKNITGLEVKRFMEEWHGRTMADTRITMEGESTCWRRQPFCNLLLACLFIHAYMQCNRVQTPNQAIGAAHGEIQRN